MRRFKPEEPFPVEMQGRWVDDEHYTYEVVVTGGEITMRGHVVEYDQWEQVPEESHRLVQLYLRNRRVPTFLEQFLTFVILPDGKLAYFTDNDGALLVRPPS